MDLLADGVLAPRILEKGLSERQRRLKVPVDPLQLVIRNRAAAPAAGRQVGLDEQACRVKDQQVLLVDGATCLCVELKCPFTKVSVAQLHLETRLDEHALVKVIAGSSRGNKHLREILAI